MRVSLISLLSLTLLVGCAGQPGPATTSGEAASTSTRTATPEEAQVAHSSAWLAEMERGGLDFGPGELEVVDVDGDGEAQRLELAALRVNVSTAGAMARYEVEHLFDNPSDQVLEGTFHFPLPAGAVVTGLAMEIDGQLMEGEILERSRAREIYEEIVDNMRDPALLEWEAGQIFKLRVFPIEPGERKRVVMRYMAPLVPSDEAASGLAVTVPTAAPAMQQAIPSLSVRLDGEELLVASDHDVRENLLVPLEQGRAPAYVEERHGGQRYLAARVDLDWSQVPAPKLGAVEERGEGSTARRTIIVVDSSRSALESWPLAREAVATVLGSLQPGEPFMVVAADLQARIFARGFVHNDAAGERRRDALAFLDAIEPDGASDLGVALKQIGEALGGERARGDRVIYLGDGTPTWGTSERGALVELARAQLGETPLYALSLGKRESRDILEALTGATGGRTLRPRTVDQVAAFTDFLERAPQVRRLSAVEVELPGLDAETTVHAPLATTWFEGERPVVHFRVADDRPPPRQLRVRGRIGDEDFTSDIELGEPEPVVGVRQQWAARELAATTDKAAAVALSVEHSVLSRHTALLVLESEEAYERYQIERRPTSAPASERSQGGSEDEPRISGRDLDGDSTAPYLGPGDLQPGDPEIHIPAPRDARSVEVVFPFGETKAARWEDALGQWTVRFLVDDDTAPGIYEVLVRVTHADGHVEILHLEYTIDVVAPALTLELKLRADGAYDVLAHQQLVEDDAARERIEGRAGDEDPRTLDARRVELLMPDGQTLHLRRGITGTFVRRWEPREPVSWPATVTAVVGDRALNYRRVELPLPEAR
jgi:hypothetical protein